MPRPPRKPRRPAPRRAGPPTDRRQQTLVRLWGRLTSEREAPALDRWLGRELGRLDGLPRDQRLWLGDLLTDAVRFGALTVFCEDWRRAYPDGGDNPAGRLAAWPAPEGGALWRRLASLPAPIAFFWTMMRKRLTGADLPAVAPPGPGALEVWKLVREACADAADPGLRALWSGLPPAALDLLRQRAERSAWSEVQTAAFCDRHDRRPPLWLRVQDPARLDAVRRELDGAGFTVTRRGRALAASGPRGIFELDAYRGGAVDIQDLASQAIGDAVAARPGERVWDCCAGAGGKSLQLAAAVGGGGLVLATDLYEAKLSDLRRRADRAGFTNIRTLVWDGTAPPDEAAGCDRVLVDAPCSGSGTWRRNPDGRLRFAPDQLAELAAVQVRLLDVAAAAVRPGGVLVYATCSWFAAENEDVVAGFLSRNGGFRLVRQTLHGNPGEDADTTFTAVFARAPAGD